jgi:hypothetical protein
MVALKSSCWRVGLLAAHLLNLNFIFLSDSGMRGRSCVRVLPLTGPIPRQLTDVGKMYFVFYIKIHPLDPKDHMLSQNLMVDNSVDLFTSRNQ